MSSLSFRLAAQHLIHSTKLTLFSLVDGLQYERHFGEELSAQHAAIPLFDTWPDSRIAFAGPWIIQLCESMEIREKLCTLEVALPSVSWILSPLRLSDLASHFKKNMNIGLPNGRTALLRFQDPRVQVRLGEMLDSLQHQELTDSVQEWLTTVGDRVWSFKQREFIC
ncbi:DUF4123 domain-containing protein [Buttiauxella noackiae]|uniref:DUF4123 domain-containing protein n=1 Tax=Buttiauxella noackiae ATCC 51607 TaxID=1354255 RepID=A0A1B7HPQ4_9ENTR|nr:DUF4123 domain-containing protein [Buttiauxella noackiae]OAT17625.1 hypothetical protein M979_2119 [Buttiauxella noackiae ATCC 51607]